VDISKVYFIKTKDVNDDKISQIAGQLTEILVDENFSNLNREIPIKVHFGEKGNTTFIPANYYNGIIEFLESKNIKPSFIETNVLYRGHRTTEDKHRELAKEHKFTQIPIIIADGKFGDDFTQIVVNKKYFENCKIGKKFDEFSQIIVTSHFKGHIMAGFGGAIKQLAMGFASRGGKLAQHSDINPVVNQEECVACGECVKKCDVEAISIDKKAFIDQEKCVGCAGCMAVCPTGAIKNDWKGKNFKEKLAEYAYGAQKNKEFIYISFLINITKECDCIGKEMIKITDNIGVLASMDPVALDSACIDLVQEQMNEKIFESGRETLIYAEKIGLGNQKYILKEII